jgi:hypothetical protein
MFAVIVAMFGVLMLMTALEPPVPALPFQLALLFQSESTLPFQSVAKAAPERQTTMAVTREIPRLEWRTLAVLDLDFI